MRLALHNPFQPAAPWAERDLALRIAIALDGMGWECRTVNTVEELEAFAPDAAVCLHPQAVPKMTAVPSLACHWNPPSIFRNAPDAVPNEVSHDAFLTAGPAVERRLRDILWGTGRPIVTTPMYPSSQGWALTPTLDAGSRFFYVGSNWDGNRFPALLEILARRGMLALHGQEERWKHLAHAFMGSLPFDGRSVIERAHACGMGLCLHLPAHFETGIPNMRIFELCAAGALTVADRHPFILEHFGDTILYVDTTLGEEATAEQILAHGDWARSHSAVARDMARSAQAIFLERFSLERLFAPLPDLLSGIRSEAGYHTARRGLLPISVVLPIGEGGVAEARERLDTLAAQTALPAEIVVAGHGAAALTRTVLGALANVLCVVELPAGHLEGSALWAGALASSQRWVTWLPDGARPFPEHLAALYDAAALWPDVCAVHADVLEPDPLFRDSSHGDAPFTQPERPWRLTEENRHPHPAGILVTSERLDPLLRADPGLGAGMAWLLAQRLAAGGRIIASRKVTIRARSRIELPPEELKRLEHFDLLQPQPAASSTGSIQPSSMPWTGQSDLNPQAAEPLARLLEPRDFASLPRDRNVYIYGASRGGRLLQLELAKWEHLSVICFLDSHRRGEAWGLPVYLPEDLPASDIAAGVVVIANQYVAACVERLSRVFPDCTNDFSLYNAYPYIHRHRSAESKLA
ncbi:hypothetical protein [Azospirillum argentinense]|uniref:glycosyltransferase family protein n=1 Tax=Azospirillum argentinense TaxID=2970906 RepID=UPI0032DEDFB5